MGDIGGLLGLGGGQAGTGFDAPTVRDVIGAPIKQPQIDTAYAGTQDTLQSQKDLLAALQAQNGLANQNQVYGQLQGIAAGTGPNPAQAMLNQTTGQNVANQAALMAGQRGVGSNAGLIARQIGQQGASTQQQAGAQAAAMQAQQSLNAVNQAGGMANTQAANQIGQTNANTAAQQAQYQSLLNAQAQLNNANVAMQSNANSINGQMANTAQQGQQKVLGGVMNTMSLGFAGMADGGVVDNSLDAPDTTVPTFAAAPQKSGGGGNQGMEMLSKILPMLMADGGIAEGSAFPAQSRFAQYLSTVFSGDAPNTTPPQFVVNTDNTLGKGVANAGKGISKALADSHFSPSKGGPIMAGGDEAMATESGPMMAIAARGGKVPALLSPGEKYLKPEEARVVAQGKVSPKQVGKTVPGTPKYKGNNYANDVVPAKLEAGGVVIPNSIMQSKDPVRGAADFVRKCLAKKSAKK